MGVTKSYLGVVSLLYKAKRRLPYVSTEDQTQGQFNQDPCWINPSSIVFIHSGKPFFVDLEFPGP